MVSMDFLSFPNWKKTLPQRFLRLLALLWILLPGWTFASVISWNPSPFSGDLVPPGMSCSEECPGIGTRQIALSQRVSPIANPCADMPLTLLFERWGAKVTFPQPQCPLWVMLEPPHALPVARSGCCLLERQSRSVLQQMLKCECTDFFIICWSRECLPAGEPRNWETLDHWVSLPCP